MGQPEREAELIEQYRLIHEKKTYGRSSEILIGVVQRHIYEIGPVRRILDYGCGRSRLVDWLAKIHDAEALRYDPAIAEYAKPPKGKADLVICTDLLEHIPEANIAKLVADIRGYSDNVFFNISCRKAVEVLPNGENAHCTVRPARWWGRTLRQDFPRLQRTRAFGRDDVSFFTWGEE